MRLSGVGLLAMVLFSAPVNAAPVALATPAGLALDAGLGAWLAADYAGARRTLRPLADRGSAVAETMLGVMASKGQGGRADPASAVGWWLRAANRGYGPAQLALAKALAAGRGVSQDTGRAWVWARLAAGTGNGTAAAAGALADGLARGFDAQRLAALEAERSAWRPWPGG